MGEAIDETGELLDRFRTQLSCPGSEGRSVAADRDLHRGVGLDDRKKRVDRLIDLRFGWRRQIDGLGDLEKRLLNQLFCQRYKAGVFVVEAAVEGRPRRSGVADDIADLRARKTLFSNRLRQPVEQASTLARKLLLGAFF